MEESVKCMICTEEVVERGNNVSTVFEKGIETLRKASVERGDGNHLQLVGLTSTKVHTSCRKDYTRASSIKAVVNKKSQRPSTSQATTINLRSSQYEFDFKTKCFYCCEVVDDMFLEKEKKKPFGKRRQVYQVRSLQMRDNVLSVANRRQDKWGEEVKLRINNVVDLVAADGIYHQDCYLSFFTSVASASGKRGRPSSDYVTEAMGEICHYLENADDCQVSISELMSQITGERVDERTVKRKLKEIYGDNIIITELKNRVSVVCFRGKGAKILTDTWYKERKKNEREERLRIVETAAAIIEEDLKCVVYDTGEYPQSDDFFKDAYDCIPYSLTAFLNRLLLKCNKNSEGNQKAQKKIITIAHVLMVAMRPRSVMSSVLLALSVFLYRKYGSRNLITLLCNLGFCSSYHEAQTYELSAMHHSAQEMTPGSFCQFIFDNADHNVSTLDGQNTFHSMGGIKCVTPASHLLPGGKIKKMTTRPPAADVGELGLITLQTYQNTEGRGLKNIVIKDLSQLLPSSQEIVIKTYDILWLCSKWMGVSQVPDWKAYMLSVTKERSCEKTAVIPLPFVRAPPTNLDTIYTVLNLAIEQCRKVGQKTCIVTFDQPLYIKARQMVAAAPPGSNISQIIVRLGGFHLIMSFLGSIGQIMAGSGLKEILCTIFAPNSVDKMLLGHAYARAVRGHFLVQSSLAHIILDRIDSLVTEEEKRYVQHFLQNFLTELPSLEKIDVDPTVKSLQARMTQALEALKQNGPTAALWIQYFFIVSLVKDYICAERSGDWNGHLKCVALMIPYFHASGHTLYAKSSHIYVQDMLNLQDVMTSEVLHKFTENGFFTMRRTESYWTGTWSDMLIEQTLMRLMKSTGGLTRGRGVTDSVLSRWINGATATLNVCASLEDFAGLTFTSSEQHTDIRHSQITRDASDVQKLVEWFRTHPPFVINSDIMSLATGVTGDVSVNCYNALEIGQSCMKKMIGNNFSDVKLARKDKVLSLASVNSAVQVHTQTTVIDPLVLFQRIAIVKENESDLIDCFQYELAPYPMALFDEIGMRKTKKSALYDIFSASDIKMSLYNYITVVDGGFLLHRVKWGFNTTFSAVCIAYVNYIKKHYGSNCTVVFDGYSNASSTKLDEQNRRSRLKKCVDIKFEENMAVTVPQDTFLSNSHNKARLINMLLVHFKNAGVEFHQSEGDADIDIVNRALEKSSQDVVVIVGEDIDLLVLLVALAPQDKNLLFLKPGVGKVDTKIFSSQEMQKTSRLKDEILFLHAFSGCDTTSATYNKGKVKYIKVLQQNEDLGNIPKVFANSFSTPEQVAEAGKRFFLAMYGASPNTTSLNEHRFICFQRSARKIKPDPASFPPTEDAARLHSFRVYHQVQYWLGNRLPPELWGWQKTSTSLQPVKTLGPPAPDSILSMIFCSCTTGCGSRCGCRKSGVFCSIACGNCEGVCLNRHSPTTEEIEEQSDEDLIFQT